MKYVLSWFERPQGSPLEYENAQKRILEVFSQWKAPANFKIGRTAIDHRLTGRAGTPSAA